MHVRARPQQSSGTAMHKSEEIAMVGQVVSEHAVTSTDQRLVCTMAMVCKDWRVAVRDKAPARLLDVALKIRSRRAPVDAGMPFEGMLTLSSFSKWLPQHAKLVRKLNIIGGGHLIMAHKNRVKALAETVFSLALRSAAAACIETSAQQLQPLGLQSYSSKLLDTSAVLQSLPIASLTELTIPGSDSSALAAALSRLTNLQRLKVYDCAGETTAAVLQAAQQLSALTELSFCHRNFNSSDVSLVPPHLLRLDLWSSGWDVADFSHLTRLTSLSIEIGRYVGYRFPAQLVELSIAELDEEHDGSCVVSISNLSSLKCLESLKIKYSGDNAEDLLQLVGLPKLQKLSLYCYGTATALAASAAWPRLRQLHDVNFQGGCSSSACMQLFGNLGKVTWLTQLYVDIALDEEDTEHQAVPIAICSEICKLQMLQDLYLDVYGERDGPQQSSWAQDDLAQLSSLTQLTKLHLRALRFDHEVINDAVVVQLLLKMKQLQELSVPIKSAAVLPVVAELSNLTKLTLYHLPDAVQRSGLKYLQGMKSLTVLEGFDECSEQELADFWAAVRA